jgi:hypothetical protein
MKSCEELLERKGEKKKGEREMKCKKEERNYICLMNR